MSKPFKKFGLFMIVLFYICLVIFFLIRDHKSDLNNVLSSSLDFIGFKLNAMVPDSKDRDSVAVAYQNFKQQVLDQKVPPEQVENVAANILNLSKTGATINPSIVSNILEYEVAVSLEVDSLAVDSPEAIISVSKALEVKDAKRVKAEELEELGVKLSSIYDFEEAMVKTIEDSANVDKELFHYMRYEAKNGLKIVVDEQTKERLKWKNLTQLNKEMERLQKDKILIYKFNYVDGLEKEKEKLEAELNILIETRHKRQAEKKRESRKTRALESLKKIEIMSITGAINPDSLKKIIEKIQMEANAISRISVKVRRDSTNNMK